MKVWILIFICMFSMPLLVAVLHFRMRKGQILKIRQDYVKDARYFGKSFSALVEKALPEMKNGTIMLSRQEKVLEADGNQEFAQPDIEDLVIARNTVFCPQRSDLHFQKEIYSEKDALFVKENIRIRAVYSKKRLLFGNKIRLLRWADAEHAVAVYDECDLGERVSSGEQLVIGVDNVFHSLYAPVIRLGQRPEEPDRFMEERDPRIFRMPVMNSHEYNRHYIDDDMVTESGTVPYTIISRGDIKVIEDIILQGDIHSDGAVRIMENASVLGNVFAENDILLEKNVTVLGDIFTQGNIIFEEGASAGQPGKITSVVARGTITFYGSNYVYGYVVSEGGGKILKSDREIFGEYCFPGEPVHKEKITFQDLLEYENVDFQGFRGDIYVKEAVIPEGASIIPKSQFFGCRSLEKLHLPESVSVIGDYAFADCHVLKVWESIEKLSLKSVGTSAFENCYALEFVSLPDSLTVIEGAAFADCVSVNKLIFSDTSLLRKIGDHAFRGCRNLKEVYLPDSVEYVGVSAFRDCVSLEQISVSEKIKDQPGIAELEKNCPNARIRFREVNSVEKE